LQHIPNKLEQSLIQLIQKYNRNEYALSRMTETMIVKSTIDASRPIVKILKESKIFNFEIAKDGEKNYLNTLVFNKDCVVECKTSFYRPKAKPNKPGDPRFWPWGFKGVAEEGTLVYITNVKDKLMLIPLTLGNCSAGNLERILGPVESDIYVLNELITKLKKIGLRWVLSCSPKKKNSKDVGDTLESEIGIEVNNSRIADYKGKIEIKAKRLSSKTADTLFSQVPDWELSPIKSVKDIILTYGYHSKHPKRIGYKDLFVTVSNKPNPQGLYLEVDYLNEQIHQYYEGGGSTSVLTAIWTFEKLRSRINEKHPKTAWLLAEEAVIDDEIHFKYSKLEISKNPIFSQFLSLIEQGIVRYDWRGGCEIEGKGRVDKGHAFRLKSAKHRDLLFGEVYSVDL
jgi:hypothetical protein